MTDLVYNYFFFWFLVSINEEETKHKGEGEMPAHMIRRTLRSISSQEPSAPLLFYISGKIHYDSCFVVIFLITIRKVCQFNMLYPMHPHEQEGGGEA